MKPSNPSANEPNNLKHAVHGPLRRKADELVLADVDAAERLVVPAAEAEATVQAAVPAETALPADGKAPATEMAADAMADADVGADGLQVAQASAGNGGAGAGAAGAGAGAAGAGAGAGAGAAGAAGAAAGAAGAAGVATATAIGAGALVSGAFVLPAALAAAAGTVALASGSSGSDSHVASAPPAAAATAPTTMVNAIGLSADTGNSASDFVTSQSAQTVTAQLSAALASGEDLWGSVDHGATWVRITDKVHGTAVAWDGVTLVAGGAIEFEVRNATGTGPAASHAYTLDTSVAAATIALETDSGISAVDHTTNHATLSIGNVEAGGVVQYSIDGGTTWTSGFAAIEGVNDVQVRVTDVAGNVSAATSFSFTLDTSVAAPTVALVAERSGTAGTGEHVTDQGTLNVGNLEAGAVVQYSIDGGATWLSSFTAVEGSNNLQVRTVDVAGNVSAATPFSFTLDTSVPDTSRPDTILNGTVTAGPVIEGNGLHVVAYRSDGTVLVDGEVSAVGTFTLNVPGSYTGPVLVMVFDTSAGADYFDEATGKPKDLGSDLRAATVIPAPGTYHVNINALTELAVRSLGLAGGDGGSAGFDLSHFDPAQITAANQAVAAALGLGGQDLVTGPAPHAIIDANGASDPTADAYGKMLAALSGAELNAGSLDAALQALGAQLAGGSLGSAGLAQLVAGAARVSLDLVDSISQITSHATAVAITSVAEDNTVNAAEAAGVVTVGGTCAAGATVNLLVGDHTVVATVVGTTWTVALDAGELAQLGQGAIVLQATATLDGTTQVAYRGIYIDTVLPGVPTLLAHDTTDSAPLLSGSADAGATLTVAVGGATFLVAVDADGHWSLDTKTATPVSGSFDLGGDGLKGVTLTSTDAAGNTSSGAGSFALDATAPAAPTVALALDSGASDNDHVTHDGRLGVGNVEAGATVEYSTDGGATWTSSFSAIEGANHVQVRVTDAFGRQAATDFSFTLDTQVGAPTVGLAVDSGNPSDAITNVGTLNLGNVEPGSTVEYSTDGGATWATGFAPVEGVNAVLVRATDAAGNQSAATSFGFTLLTQPPAAASVALVNDSGASATDHVTHDGTLSVGNLGAGSTVEYSTDLGATWVSTFSAVEGANHVQVRVSDPVGNRTVTDFDFTLDTQVAAPTVGLVTDSGIPGDAITNTGTLALGNVEAGALVEYSTDGGATWATGFTPVEGVNAVLVRATDAAGNQSAATSFGFTLLTQPPAAASVALVNDSGASATDHVTHDGTLSVGNLGAGSTVEYSTDFGATWVSTFSAVEGANHVQVRVSDPVGNRTVTDFDFTLDTQVAAPTVGLVSDSGNPTDKVTNAGTLNLGNVEAGAVVQYSTDSGATWTTGFTPAEGLNTLLVRTTDAAGNQSVAVPFSFTLDTTAPTMAPTVGLALDTGASNFDHLTSVGTLAVGNLQPGETAQYSVDGGTTWTASFVAASGLNVVMVRAVDAAGNSGPPASFNFTLDATAPAAPSVALTTDSGASATDHVSKFGTLAVTNVESGASVQYSIDSGTTWTSSFSAVEGANSVLVRTTDSAGNHSTSVPLAFTLDTTIGSLQALSVPEAANGIDDTEAASGGGVGITVPFASGALAGDVITLRVIDPNTSQPIVYSHTVTSAEVTAGQANLVVASADLSGSGAYVAHVTLTDAAGNESAERTASFTVLPGLTDDTCLLFGFARRDYPSDDPKLVGGADSNVFLLTNGISSLPTDELAIYEHRSTLLVGADLGNTTVGGAIGAGGIAADYGNDMTGRDIVIGAAAIGSLDEEMIWVDQLAISMTGGFDASAEVYVLADAVGADKHKMAGAFDVSASIDVAGAAHAGGALVANAGGGAAQAGVAEVEACEVSIVAHGGTGADAYLGVQPSQLGAVAIGALNQMAGIGAYAAGHGQAMLAIHEDVTVAATADAGAADAGIYAILASAYSNDQADAHASVDLGGNVTIQAQAAAGTASAHLDEAVGAEMGNGQGEFTLAGNLTVMASGAAGAHAAFGRVTASADNGGAADVRIGGDVIVGALSMAGDATATMSMLEVIGGDGATAQVTIDGNVLVGADAAGDARAHFSSVSVVTNPGGEAVLNIGGTLAVGALAIGGAATATLSYVYAQVNDGDGNSVVTIDGGGGDSGGGVVVYANGETGAHGRLGSVYAEVESVAGQARVAILNGSVYAEADQGSATASVGNVYASALALGAVGQVAIGSDFLIDAEGASAKARMTALMAVASSGNASADVNVGGRLELQADAGATASAALDSLSAHASGLGALARLEIGSDLEIRADASQGSATAKLGHMSVVADAGATAQIEIGGDFHAAAHGVDGASAALSALGVTADGSGNALLHVGGNLTVEATADAGAAVAAMSLYVCASGSELAHGLIDGDVRVSANGGTDASADLEYIGTTGNAVEGRTRVDIGGNVRVDAQAHGGDALANLSYIYAVAYSTGADAQVHIGGDVTLQAESTAGSANVSVGNITASASGDGAYAQLSIDGDITLSAVGDTHAEALLDRLGATASASGAQAHVDIGGNVAIAVTANAGRATRAVLDHLFATAAAADASATLSIGGDVSVVSRALGGDQANAKFSLMEAHASAANAVAQVTIDGGVLVSADGGSGASATLGHVSALAGGDGAQALVDIGGNVTVQSAADSSTAYAALNGVKAFVSASNGLARIDIGGIVVTAESEDEAIVVCTSIYAFAGAAGGQAYLTIANGVTVRADSTGDTATATASVGCANAMGANALAQVEIGGDVLISAHADSDAKVSAYAPFANADANNAQAVMHVAGNVDVHAVGGRSASVAMNTVYADALATGAHAHLDIDGSLVLGAQGASGAQATFSSLHAIAGCNAEAVVHIGGNLVVGAESSAGSASVAFGLSVMASAASGNARVVIDDDLHLTATGAQGASVSADTFNVYASGDRALAQLEIGGDLVLDATAANGASASMNGFDAVASGTSAVARIDVHGDIKVSATLNGGAPNASASAQMGSVSATASGSRAEALVIVHGNIEVESHGWGQASISAAASVSESLNACADGISSHARIEVMGDVRISADAAYGDHGIVSPSNLSASAEFYGISASASADNAVSQVVIGGGIDVYAHAAGNNGSAEADVGSISASASGSGAVAQIAIGGDIVAHADAGTGAGAYAGVELAGMDASASSGAAASVQLVGNVEGNAEVHGANVEAVVTMDWLSATASTNAMAQIGIGGNVTLHALADGASAHASAVFFGVESHARVSGVAIDTVTGNVDISSDASAGGSATAIFQTFFAYANGSATADVSIGGNLDVTALGAAAANARVFDLWAKASGSSDDAQATLAGHLHVTATGDIAQAQLAYHEDGNDGDVKVASLLARAAQSSGQADLTVGDDVWVRAFGGAHATAYNGGASAFAANSATAQVHIEGDIVSTAVATDNVATAMMGQYSHYATPNAGSSGPAFRQHGGLVANADGSSSDARVIVDGDVTVGATGGLGARAALYSLSAHAASSASAVLSIAGNLAVTADGGNSGNARVDVYDVRATGTTGASSTCAAHVSIGGDVTIEGTGGGDANVFAGIWSAVGTNATLHVGGDVEFAAHAGANVELQAGFFADEGADIDMGNVKVDADSTGVDTDADGDLLFIAGAYDSGSLHLASLDVTLDVAGAAGAVFLGADSDKAGLPTEHDYSPAEHGQNEGAKYWSGNGVDDGQTQNVEIDALSVAAGSGANLTVWIDHMAYDESRTATLSGGGDIAFLMNDPAYGVIDAGNLTGSLHFAEMLAGTGGDADHAFTQINQFDYTVIKGFDVSADTIGFGNMQVDVGTWRDLVNDGGVKHDVDGLNYGFTGNVNVINASQTASMGSFTTESGLLTALNSALDGNALVAYAKYDGNLNLAGTANDITAGDPNHDWYVVAYDGDGTGITSVVLVQVAEGQQFGNLNVGP